MRVHVCGSRGSTAAPGREFVRYGGHTSCVALARDGDPPRLLLDAGTGIRRVTSLLGGRAFEGTILLTHLHWDHLHGLPFFAAADQDEARTHVYLPEQERGADDLLEQAMSPPIFPIDASGLRGTWRFESLREGEHTIEGFTVVAREIPHKGGRTFGYRISDGDTSVAYLPDHHPAAYGPGPTGAGAEHDAARVLADGVDLLIHDAQHTAEEYASQRDFGHTTLEYALGLARTCGVGRLLAFHHDPGRTDDDLDTVAARVAHHDPPVLVAADGQVLDLVPTAAPFTAESQPIEAKHR